MFVDRVEVELIAGKGGNGCMAFRREMHVPRGGPCGGDGGNGGSLILEAKDGVNSLLSFAHQRHWRADNGANGLGSNCHGKAGKDSVLFVPPGTIIIDKETGIVIRDLVEQGDRIVAARGGRGGFGNTHFKSSTNQAPRETGDGGQGQRRKVVLELKSIADVGLVGKPNAGKSTLLSRLSRARPEIADYPFTTKIPNLGLVAAGNERTFVLADIPGLIEGAADGVGLGHDFLRHIMRAGLIVHLVEPCPADGTDPIENYNAIRAELSHYSSELAERFEIVVMTKSELPDFAEVFTAFESAIGKPALQISAVTGSGLNILVNQIATELESSRTATAK